MTAVLELNDSNLTLGIASGDQLSSPAFAVVDGDTLLLGAEAVARSRLDPRKTFDRFWQDLDQQPLTRPAANARNHADIAWYHLKQLWEQFGQKHGTDHNVILAVPASFSRDQLALLLGIAQACKISIAGLVESTVCANTNIGQSGDRLLLDISLHRLNGTLVTANGELSFAQHHELARQGLVQLQEKWLHAVAEIFVRETRFDPLHEAPTEQQLFDQLPQLVKSLQNTNSTSIELPAGPRTHRVHVSRELLSNAAKDLYKYALHAAENHKGVVIASPRLAQLPGLPELLASVCELEILGPNELTRGALAHADAIASDPESPAWVTRLPLPSARSVLRSTAGSIAPKTAVSKDSSKAAPVETTDSQAATASTAAAATNAPVALLYRWQLWNFSETTISLGQPPRVADDPDASTVLLRNGAALLRINPKQPVWRNRLLVTADCELALGDSLQLSEHGDEIRLVGNGQT